MKITRLEDCPAMPVLMDGVKGAKKQVPIGIADGVPNFSIRVFTLEAGGHTPHHAHAAEHLNYVLEGEGDGLPFFLSSQIFALDRVLSLCFISSVYGTGFLNT